MMPRLPPDNLILVIIGALAIFGLAAGNEVINAERHVAGVGYAVNYNEFDGLQGFHNYMN